MSALARRVIPIELCRHQFSGRVVAIDLAKEMLKLANLNIDRAGLANQIQAALIDAKQMPYMRNEFDAVISNSIVHHIPQPSRVLLEMVRVLAHGGLLFVRDLLRPESLATIDHFVATYAGQETRIRKRSFAIRCRQLCHWKKLATSRVFAASQRLRSRKLLTDTGHWLGRANER